MRGSALLRVPQRALIVLLLVVMGFVASTALSGGVQGVGPASVQASTSVEADGGEHDNPATDLDQAGRVRAASGTGPGTIAATQPRGTLGADDPAVDPTTSPAGADRPLASPSLTELSVNRT